MIRLSRSLFLDFLGVVSACVWVFSPLFFYSALLLLGFSQRTKRMLKEIELKKCLSFKSLGIQLLCLSSFSYFLASLYSLFSIFVACVISTYDSGGGEGTASSRRPFLVLLLPFFLSFYPFPLLLSSFFPLSSIYSP